MTQWPADAAFDEHDAGAVAAALRPDVSCTIQKASKRGVSFRLSIRRDVLRDQKLDAGDRFKVLITETAAAFYIRLVKNAAGRVQMSIPPLSAKKPHEAKRLLLSISGLPDAGLGPRKNFEPVWRFTAAGLDLRFDKPAAKPPAASALHDDLAERLARKWARGGDEPEEIVKRMYAEQNKRVTLGWVLRVLNGEV